jgi:hypothetical protein
VIKFEPFTFEGGDLQVVGFQSTEMNISTYSSAYIRMLMSKRIGLAGEAARMRELKNAYHIVIGGSDEKRPREDLSVSGR